MKMTSPRPLIREGGGRADGGREAPGGKSGVRGVMNKCWRRRRKGKRREGELWKEPRVTLGRKIRGREMDF